MNADYSYIAVGHPERMVYRFSIIGYLFGRELWRKTFFCDDKNRGIVYCEWYLQNKVSNIACDLYQVEVYDTMEETTRTVIGGRAPKKQDPWKSDCADAAMRVGVGAGRH